MNDSNASDGTDAVTWFEVDGVPMTCQSCGQAAKVNLHGDRIDVKSFTECSTEDTLAGLDVDALHAELRKRHPSTETADPSRRRLRVRRADLTRVRPVEWLWQERLPLGFLSLLVGEDGIGKGVLTSWLVARATRGELPGDLAAQPRRVLIVGDEDAFDQVIVPRLYAAGADIDLIDELYERDGTTLDVRRDADPLRETVSEGGYALVYVDQLLDVLGADTDDWRSKSVRDTLRPLRRLARDLDVTVLGTLHPNKGQRASFRDLVGGSNAFNAVSRSSFLVAQHPHDESRRVLVRGKGNLSKEPPSFEFEIRGREVEVNGRTFNLPVVADECDGELTRDELLKPDRPAPVRESLADKIDALGAGEVQSRAELARALGREPADRSVGRALDQLEADGRWLKEGRGKWRRIGIGASSEAPMSKTDGSGVVVGRIGGEPKGEADGGTPHKAAA